MESKTTIQDLRESHLSSQLRMVFTRRMQAMPAIGIAFFTMALLDGERARVWVLGVVVAFEFAVAIYYFLRSRKIAPGRQDVAINVVAVALGGVTVLYVTGDVHSPLLPFLILPATLIGGAFGREPIRYLILLPIVGLTLLTLCAMFGWIPRFTPLFDAHPDWMVTLRTAILFFAILQAWRITGWLTHDILQMAREVELAHDDLANQFELRQRASALFVGQLAHELRNPLASVKGLTELVRSRPEADNAEHLRVIGDEIRRLEATLDATLSFGRPAPLGNPAFFDLQDSMLSALRILQAKMDRLGIMVDVRWHEPLPYKGDEQSFRQVFYNLISNSIEAMPDGGRISISGQREPEGIRVTLRDNGPGIPPALTGKVFEPYVSGKAEGTGLGLSIVRQIIHAHGGRIQISSTEGEGTTVDLRLP
jgi:signal transduction histidine kinase